LAQCHRSFPRGCLSQGACHVTESWPCSITGHYVGSRIYDANRPAGALASACLCLHATLAINPVGTPLGIIDAQCWARNPEEYGKKAKRHSLPIEEKESNKWLKSFRAATSIAKSCPEKTAVSVGDREADIYELFSLVERTPNAPFLLVRARHDRKLAAEQGHLLEHLSQCPEAGIQELVIPRRGNHPARTARLTVRHSKVTLAGRSQTEYRRVTTVHLGNYRLRRRRSRRC
jgi:hypothetical protein